VERRADLHDCGLVNHSTIIFVRETASVNDTSDEPTSIATLTAEIVSAYVSRNQIASSELGGLISAVAGQLGKIGAAPEQPAEEKPAPAVSVRRSIRPDHLVCLVCGKPKKTLKRHLAVRHDLSPAEYREHFGLKPDYPMTAPNYTQQRREVALATGLGRLKEPASQPRKGRRVTNRGERRGDDARP
jgi:predicted transcriptional regulator